MLAFLLALYAAIAGTASLVLLAVLLILAWRQPDPADLLTGAGEVVYMTIPPDPAETVEAIRAELLRQGRRNPSIF